jgi:salicylate hydroxylase
LPRLPLFHHPKHAKQIENEGTSKMKAVIAGGGIGGLATAVALSMDNWDVEVVERAPALQEVGAGLQISPNGMCVLDHLKVTPHIEETLYEPETLEMRQGDGGRGIFQIKLKEYCEQRWGNRFIQIHRADLHSALQTRARELGVQIRPRSEVTGYIREGNGASVYVNGQDRIHGDIVIGADGMKSALRAQLAGPDRARFTGNVAWRITVPTSELDMSQLPKGGCVWVGGGKHAVTTRIKAGDVVNFVGIVKQSDWQEEGWTIPGTKDQALADFGDWDPVLEQIIRHASDLHRWALFDRPALAKWSDGPVALLGDAAHSMLPSMAQGAVQALEDAVILTKMLRTHDNADTAMNAYCDARLARTSKIVKRSSENLSLFHTSGAMAQATKFGPIWIAGKLSQNLIHRQQDWIYGYNVLKD